MLTMTMMLSKIKAYAIGAVLAVGGILAAMLKITRLQKKRLEDENEALEERNEYITEVMEKDAEIEKQTDAQHDRADVDDSAFADPNQLWGDSEKSS